MSAEMKSPLGNGSYCHQIHGQIYHLGSLIQNYSKLLSEFPFIGHGNTDNNLESSCMYERGKEARILKFYIFYSAEARTKELENQSNQGYIGRNNVNE
jgi:hypothetical protein